MAAVEKLKTEDQYSAGGVAYRNVDGRLEIAVILTEPERRWQLPKGMIDEGETSEQAAQREVREEAGIDTELVRALDQTEYWYVGNYDGERKRFHKRVSWFLMKYISGDPADHDHEVAEARWATVREALDLLVFKNEREVVEKAVKLIGSL
ncbi:MAG: NUDIX hydrolase [Acidobacteria bacterium]|nr:NUDIX hydrolase [Acidobacteriota bacterium]